MPFRSKTRMEKGGREREWDAEFGPCQNRFHISGIQSSCRQESVCVRMCVCMCQLARSTTSVTPRFCPCAPIVEDRDGKAKSQDCITVKAREKTGKKKRDECDRGVVGSVVARLWETLSLGTLAQDQQVSLKSFFLVTQLALPPTIHLFFIILSYYLSCIYWIFSLIKITSHVTVSFFPIRSPELSGRSSEGHCRLSPKPD